MTESMLDLRSLIQEYERAYPNDVWRVADLQSVKYDITALVMELERRDRAPMIIFENLDGFDGVLVTNVFASRERIAFILGTDLEHLHDTWAARTRHLLPPRFVAGGPIKQNIKIGDAVNIEKLPIPTHFSTDAGRYISSGICVARDPDTGIGNLAFARMQVKGPRRLGISVHSKGHFWDYLRRAEAMGRDLDVAVVIGGPPAAMLASGSRAPLEVDEYDIAGALQGEPMELVRAETVDLGVPAQAELVLEGRILAGVREPEGPFGEYTGYSTSRSTENVLEVTAITHRDDPIYLNVTPGFCSDHLFLDRIQKETTMLQQLQATVSGVTALHYPKSGTLFHCYVAMNKTLEGQPQQAATLLLGLDQYVKLVVIVDSDVDVTNEAEVLWAMATRMQANRDTSIIDHSLCNVLDPSSENGMSAKMMIDATAPLVWHAIRHELPPESQLKARQLVDFWITRPARD